MADVQITCITKPHALSSHEHITHVGNPRANWKWTREQVIASIDAGANTFFVIDPFNGKRSNVGVVRRPAGFLTSGPMPTATGTTICCRLTSAHCGDGGFLNGAIYVRVELHRANQDDYDALHSAMEEEGFSREIKSSDGTRYHLPTAEYNRTSSMTRQQIRDSAAAASTTGKKYGILVTESAGRAWEGLKEV